MTPLPRIVVTGYGFVSPIGSTPQQAVQALREGRSGIRSINLGGHFDILMGRVPDSAYPDREPDMSLEFAVDAAETAITNARLDATSVDPWRVTTIISSSKGRLATILDPEENKRYGFRPDKFPGNTIGLAIARKWRFSGAVLNYSAACATGLHSIIRAAQALQCYEADVALAGSSESSGTALLMAGFRNMGAISDSPVLPFHRNRAGFNPGEGAAVFLLEREEDALARHAPIVARLTGWDQRSDAHHITSAESSGETIAYAIRKAIRMAGWSPSDIEYVNAHGTGTPLNDLVEGRSIISAFGPNTPLVSSLKPYIGHLLGASSAVELALVISSLKAGYIPPTLGLNDPDPRIPLQFVSPEGTNASIHRIMKLSLGFGGHIGVVTVELP